MFSWDEGKRRANLVKHGIDLSDAEVILEGPTVTTEDNRFDYGERRWVTVLKHEERYFLSQISD